MLQELLLPLCDLVGMDVEALSQIGQRRLFLERFQRPPCFEYR